MNWHNRNKGRQPSDPDYIDTYDPAEDYEAYCEAQEEKEQLRKEND